MGQRTSPRLFGVRAITLAAAGLSAPAVAGVLQIDPVKVEIHGERKIGSLTLRNEAGAAVRVRAYALSWTQVDGKDLYVEAHDVVVSPPIFTIPPESTQLIRVGLRKAPKPSTYRLILEELPEPSADQGVQVALRLDLPVYVLQKAGSVNDLAWSARQQPDGRWVIGATNRGTGYVRVDGEELSRRSGVKMPAGLAGTVLPGSYRAWPLGQKPNIVDSRRFAELARPVGKNDTAPPEPPR